MANCPKCNAELHLRDWRAECPHCGANIVLYDQQERLMQDADKAEVQYYHFQKKVDRVKASFVGSKLAIVRIVTSLLPIPALLLPLIGGASVASPLIPYEGNLGGIEIYKLLNEPPEGFDLGAAVSQLLSGDMKRDGMLLLISVGALLLTVVGLLLHLVLNMLACSPKGKIRNYLQDILMLVLGIVSAAAFMSLSSGIVTGRIGIGGWLYLALLLLNFVIDVLVFRQGIEVKHKQCYVGGIPIEEYFDMLDRGVPQEEIREEMYKRLYELQQKKKEEIEKLAEKKVSV